MGGVTVYLWNQERSQRQEENVANDLFACERGNVLRDEIRELAEAGRTLDSEILRIIFSRVQDQELIEQLERDLGPAFAEFDLAVDDINNVSCEDVIRGVG
jgi:hypothetical protein